VSACPGAASQARGGIVIDCGEETTVGSDVYKTISLTNGYGISAVIFKSGTECEDRWRE